MNPGIYRVLEIVDEETSRDVMNETDELDFLMDLIHELDQRALALSEEMELGS